MVLREDFYSINEKTLHDYYREAYGKNVSIGTVGWSLKNRIHIYPHIGIIMTKFPNKKILQYLLNEYNVRNNTLKYALAKVYVLCCYFSLGLLASKGLQVSDPTVFTSFDAIIPANRKIRIYNFRENYVDAIIKDTFTDKYFKNELCFRLNHAYDFIPPIITHGANWYREDILSGQPLARITDDALYNQSINDAVDAVGVIAKDTLSLVDPLEYAERLYNEILGKMVSARVKKKIDCYEKIITIANVAQKKASSLCSSLPVVVSHGDLQTGNVWVDVEKKKTYVIDWETHDKRSVWYDCATILLSTRRAGKLKEMMQQRETELVKKAVFRNDPRKEYDMLAVMGILTLEDIMFYLDDMLELPEDYGGDIFNRIAGELELMWMEELK